jgi:hypothetical protein
MSAEKSHGSMHTRTHLSIYSWIYYKFVFKECKGSVHLRVLANVQTITCYRKTIPSSGNDTVLVLKPDRGSIPGRGERFFL